LNTRTKPIKRFSRGRHQSGRLPQWTAAVKASLAPAAGLCGVGVWLAWLALSPSLGLLPAVAAADQERGGPADAGAQVAGDEGVAAPAAERRADRGAGRRGIILPLKEDINPLSGELLRRKFERAIEQGVDVIILDIESPGGWVDVTFELMDLVQEAEDVETVAYIEKDAISGAALVSLATDTILMHPDARMGDAGEIVMGPDGAFRYTEAKSRSVLAQKVRDVAAATGRPLALAEKMTDKDMVVFQATHKTTGETKYLSDKDLASMEDADQWEVGKPIREAGKEMFFTVNGRRAVELGMADQTVTSRDQLAEVLNLQEPIPVIERTGMDTVILILNSSVAAFLLVLIGLIALGVELSAPGLGIGGLVSILCFGLFFWSRFLGGTAGWLEVVLFVSGLLFIAAEVFVIPGFGVAGVSGLALTLGSLVMASRRVTIPDTTVEWSSLGGDVLTIVGAFTAFLVAIAVIATFMGDIPFLKRLTLQPQVAMSSSEGSGDAGSGAGGAGDASPGDSPIVPSWQRVQVGQSGTTLSALRPGGKVMIDDLLVDVVTEGDYVDANESVQIIAKQGARVVVRPVT